MLRVHYLVFTRSSSPSVHRERGAKPVSRTRLLSRVVLSVWSSPRAPPCSPPLGCRVSLFPCWPSHLLATCPQCSSLLELSGDSWRKPRSLSSPERPFCVSARPIPTPSFLLSDLAPWFKSCKLLAGSHHVPSLQIPVGQDLCVGSVPGLFPFQMTAAHPSDSAQVSSLSPG